MESLITKINRYRQSRGYGIQSPSDYDFIRNVIRERLPYYAYAAMKKRFPKLNTHMRALCELYFRLANYSQPETVVIKSRHDDIYAEYMKAACRTLTCTTTDISTVGGTRAMIVADYKEIAEKTIETVSKLKEKSVVVVENLHNSDGEKWNTLQQQPCVGTSYDMRKIGILVVEPKLYQKHYIINL